MPTPCIVLTTLGENHDARAFARQLVEKRLAACVNIVRSVDSVYVWEGKLESEHEQLLLIKTVQERLPALREHVRERHPYKVPELLVLPVQEVEESYLAWLLGSVGEE